MKTVLQSGTRSNGMPLKQALAAATIFALAGMAAPANAAVLVDHGITYELDLTSITNAGLTGNFILSISGINTASDTEGGRTGINGFAFGDPAIGNAVSGAVTNPGGFTFQFGGLNSGGCDGSGNFFCFKNTSAVFPSPLPSAGSLVFNVTSNTVGSWAAWNPDFKIDWTGSKNNYDLVSKDIPLNTCAAEDCPTPTPLGSPVPEPSTWAMMLLGFGAIGATLRRRKVVTRRVRFSFAS